MACRGRPSYRATKLEHADTVEARQDAGHGFLAFHNMRYNPISHSPVLSWPTLYVKGYYSEQMPHAEKGVWLRRNNHSCASTDPYYETPMTVLSPREDCV